MRERRLAEALAEALSVEARSPPDPSRGEVRVRVEDSRLVVEFTARDLAAARALLNAYLGLAASVLDALREVERVGSEAAGGRGD